MSWRRILILSLSVAAVVSAAAWLLLQRSAAATALVRRELARLFAVPVEVVATALDLAAARLSVYELKIGDPTAPGRSLLRVGAAHAEVGIDPFGDLLGLRRVVLEDLAFEAGPDWPTLASLLTAGAPGGSGRQRPPVIELRRGSALLHLRDGEPPLLLEAIELVATPIAGASHGLQLRGTARVREPAAALQLVGEADLDGGAAFLSVAALDVDCDEATLARLHRLVAQPVPGFAAAGRIRAANCVVRLPDSGTTAGPVIDASAELTQVRVELPDLPPLIRSADVAVHASSTDGLVLTACIQQRRDDGEIEVQAQARTGHGELALDVRLRGRNVGIDDDALAALASFDVGREVIDALRPTTGRADLDLFLRDPHRRGGLAELELVLRDVAMAYHGFGEGDRRIGFPLPLAAARGRVRLRDDVLLLDDVEARIDESVGGGHVRLSGRIDTSAPSGEDVAIDIDAEGVAFHPKLRAALAELLRDGGELYDRLAPTGRTAVKVHVRPASELPGGIMIEVLPTDAAVRWAGFPYDLDELRGSIVVAAQHARFELAGRHGSGRLAMRGSIPLAQSVPDPLTGFETVVELRDVRIDDDLRQAVMVLAPELEAAWIAAAPSGLLNGQVKAWRPVPDDPLFHDARLELAGVTLQLPVAPWRAEGLDGDLVLHGDETRTRVDIEGLRGRLGAGGARSAHLAVLGQLEAGDRLNHDLAFVLRDLELDDAVGKALDELGALPLPTWRALQASGRVDLVSRHRLTPAEDRVEVVVQLVDVRSDAPMLPRPAEHMTGELRVADGEVTFRDLRAELGGALVQCWDGRIGRPPAPDDRTEISFSVRSNDFPIDDGIANLFSDPLRSAILARQLTGQADIDGLRFRLRIPDAGSALSFETTVQGQIALDGIDLVLGTGREAIRLEAMRGFVDLAESTVSERGGALRGSLRSGSLVVLGHLLDAMGAAFVADAERLELRTMDCRLHGGAVQGADPGIAALTYLLPGPAAPAGRLIGHIDFDGVDVYSLLTTCGWVNPPYSGSASGRAMLDRLDGSDVLRAEANGELQITRADLGVVPLFAAIYAQLPAADRPRFNHLDVRFRLADQRIIFEELDIRSDILAAQGRGSLDLDGYLDVRMRLNNLLGNSADPLVMPLIDALAKEIVRFHLFGYLRDLRAEKRWLTERSPGRRPVVPMPPELPRPAPPAY